MTNVTNNHSSRLFIGGVLIAPGATAAVPKWDSVKDTGPIKGLLDGKFITVSGESAAKANGAGELPGTGSNPGPTDKTHPAGQLPAGQLPGAGGAPAPSAEDAEKEAIIAELQKFGIEKTKRTSLENLRSELDKAKADAAAKAGNGGLPGTNGGGLPGTSGQ